MKKFGYSKINALICSNLHLTTIRLNAEGVNHLYLRVLRGDFLYGFMNCRKVKEDLERLDELAQLAGSDTPGADKSDFVRQVRPSRMGFCIILRNQMILQLRRNADYSTGVKDWDHILMTAESRPEDEILYGKI